MRVSVLLILVLCVPGCMRSTSDSYYRDQESIEKSLRMIQKRTGIDIPEGALGLHVYEWDAIDPAFLAKVELTAQAAVTVKEQVEVLPDETSDMTEYLTANVEWWKPSSGSVVVEREFERKSETVQVILSEEDGRPMLYVMWCTM